VRAATRKYDVFSKVFSQLSGESQNKLVKVAYHLLKTHKLVKHETAKQKSDKGQIDS